MNQAAARVPQKLLACTPVFDIFVYFRESCGTRRKCSLLWKNVASEIAATKPKVVVLQSFSNDSSQTPTVETRPLKWRNGAEA